MEVSHLLGATFVHQNKEKAAPSLH